MGDRPCTILIQDDSELVNQADLKKQLEFGGDDEKISALKKIILMTINGEKMPGILMTVIRFVMTNKNHTLKKLTLLFWEVIEKTGPDGKLLSEMILVCNSLRNDLNHPNEYIRGSTLRFLCKLKEAELLEPLVPSVKANLEYRHAYVRRNAVLALYYIYKEHEMLCPDAPDLIYQFLRNDEDASCKRNAFIMLFNCAQDKAIEYINGVLDQVPNFGDIQQFVVIELIRKVCKSGEVSGKSKYIRCIISLLQASSPAVQYEAASALLALSPTPAAIKAAASTFISLLCSQSDNNVKLIILDRLIEIKKKHSKVLQELLMDVLRALACPTLDIRKKTLDFAMDLVTPRNIEEVVQLLKKEIAKTQSAEFDKAATYRQMLIQAIHSCAVKFPDVASSVVHALMDYLGDSNVASAVDVIDFVSEVVETYPDRRRAIVRKLLENLYQVKSPTVFRASLWIIGEYSETTDDIDAALTGIKEALGEPPFLEVAKEEGAAPEAKPAPAPVSSGPKVLADGTYASQSAYEEPSAAVSESNVPSLRSLLIGGDFFLGAVVGTTLTKLALKLRNTDIDPVIKNSVTAEVMLILTSIILLGQKGKNPIDADSNESLLLCLKVLTHPDTVASDILITEPRKVFAANLEAKKLAKAAENESKEVDVEADDLINFRLLRNRRLVGDVDTEDDEMDLIRATGLEEERSDKDGSLQRVYQLTGFSDPLYAEAYVHVHRYDIVLDVLIINRTKDTLQNVSLELATLGDLKLCERPQTYTIGARDKIWIKANIKVSSTETGIIFGNLVYDIAGSSSSDKNCVVLNDIHIDIMDYINPATCSEVMFRVMWAEFEWENKVIINSNIPNCLEFLEHVINFTNMKCLTPKAALEGDCGFLSANLYARSIFGEDALANVSIEELPDGKVSGYIRIRSKTQGIALSLGDKITLKQASKDA